MDVSDFVVLSTATFSTHRAFPVLSSIVEQLHQTYNHMTSINWPGVGNWLVILNPYSGRLELRVKNVMLSLGVWTVRYSCIIAHPDLWTKDEIAVTVREKNEAEPQEAIERKAAHSSFS